MRTLDDLNEAIQALDINDLVNRSLDETKDEAAVLNRDDLSVGLLGTSNPITPQYSPAYAKKKGFSTPNLFVTGAFYKSIYARASGSTLEFGGTDIKAPQLEARYTKGIYGLTADSKAAYVNGTLGPVLHKNLVEALRL